MNDQPQTTLTAIALAIAILYASPAQAACRDYYDEQEDLTSLADKTPDDVRQCILAHLEKLKANAEVTIEWGKNDLMRAEEGIRRWTK